MKKLKKLWRGYFLAIARMPVMWGGVVGLTIFLAWFLCKNQLLNYPPLKTLSSLDLLLIIWLVSTIFFIALHLYVVKKKITIFSARIIGAKIIYDQNGKPKMYENPIWGKVDYKIIKFSKDLDSAIFLSRRYHLRVQLSVEVDDKKIIYPFLLGFVLKEMPTAWDFQDLVLSQESERQKQKFFIFDDCLQFIFTKFNLEKNQSELERLSRQLLNHRDERDINLDMISTIVSFPSQLLPAMVQTSLIRDEIKMCIFDREYSI
jgi:hypothetical protein